MNNPLAIIIPTIGTGRWHWLVGFDGERGQLARVAEQMESDDRLVLVLDSPDDEPPETFYERLRAIGSERITMVSLAYDRPTPPVGCVNRARNAGAMFAPRTHNLVEIDDHDMLADRALDEIRTAFAGGADYVFGWQKQQAIIIGPNGRGWLEPWPNIQGEYSPGAFQRGEVECIQPRAITRNLWDRLAGWKPEPWPGGDMDFASRAEASGANIACVQRVLCTVLIDPSGISGSYGGDRASFAAVAAEQAEATP